MKGISAIIATILLLLIVIAIVGFTFGFFQNLFTTSTTASTNQLNTTTTQTSQSFRIENIDRGSASTPVRVTVLSTGGAALITNNLAVYVGGLLTTGAGWSTTGVRSTWTAAANGACVSGTIYKISGPANFDQVTC